MDPLTLILILIIGFFVMKSGGLSSLIGGQFGGIPNGPTSNIPVNVTGQTGNVNIPPTGYIQPPAVVIPQQQTFSAVSSGVQNGLQATQTALSSAASAGSSVAQGALKALPIVGAAIASIISIFSAQSAKRAAQARNENSAVAQAVPGWDAFIAAIANAYNQGQITAAQAKTGIDAAWKNFWAETGPQIQPGRNGCQSGGVTQPSNVSFCGGKTYGAACCVGYDDLKNSNNNMKAAIDQTEKSGKPSPAIILPVFASKYGGINRPQYTITFIRPR